MLTWIVVLSLWYVVGAIALHYMITNDPNNLSRGIAACIALIAIPQLVPTLLIKWAKGELNDDWDSDNKRKHRAQKKKDQQLIGTFIYLMGDPMRHSSVFDAAKRLDIKMKDYKPEGGFTPREDDS